MTHAPAGRQGTTRKNAGGASTGRLTVLVPVPPGTFDHFWSVRSEVVSSWFRGSPDHVSWTEPGCRVRKSEEPPGNDSARPAGEFWAQANWSGIRSASSQSRNGTFMIGGSGGFWVERSGREPFNDATGAGSDDAGGGQP